MSRLGVVSSRRSMGGQTCLSLRVRRDSGILLDPNATSGAHKTYVLVDEQNRDILALGGEAVECSFNSRGLGLCVYNEEVLLAVRRLGNMLRYPSVYRLRRASQ